MTRARSVESRRGRASRSAVLLAAGLGALLAAVACQSSSPSTTTGDIPIGTSLPITGLGSIVGVGTLEGAEVAVQQINAAGGANGRKIYLISGDTHSDPVDAVPVAQQQIAVDHIVASYGPAGDQFTATANRYVSARVPIVSFGGDTHLNKMTSPYEWRVTPSDDELGVAMTLIASKRGYKSAAFMFASESTAQALKVVVKAAWQKLGGTIAVDQDLAVDQSSYNTEMLNITNAHPDVIFMQIDAQMAGVAFRAMQKLNGLSIPVIGDDNSGGPDFISAIGLAAAQKVLTSTDTGLIDNPAFTQFVDTYTKLRGHAPLPYANYGYDALTLIGLAIEAAGSTDGAAIAAAIPQVETSAPDHVIVYNYADGLAALKAGKKIKYIGCTGPLDFNEFHNVFGPFAGYKATDANGGHQLLVNLTPADLAAATP